MSWALVAAITAGSQLGDTTSVPPADLTSATWARDSTVPAPITARAPQARAKAAMLDKGSGEFSGTSMRVMPAAMIASAMSTASDGSIPRRIAINGRMMSPFVGWVGFASDQLWAQASAFAVVKPHHMLGLGKKEPARSQSADQVEGGGESAMGQAGADQKDRGRIRDIDMTAMIRTLAAWRRPTT